MKLYNTLSRKKEDLPNPEEQRKIRLFVCGPTVYDYAHIGHARTYLFFDFFAKYLRHRGYEVNYLQNITDIDDKIIARAAERNIRPDELAKQFTGAYFEDMRAIGVDAVTTYAPATDFISQIVAQVKRLIDKGFAYKIEDDGWYFDISKDEDYGKLSGRTVAQAEDGVSRIDDSDAKRNKGDFCLWKFSKPDEPKWNTQIGTGRPGWHIEDTAISEYYFGPQYDIHGGADDLKFPHHEAEIAQQESASGLKPFVQFWVHTGFLLVDGKKMSKSLDNYIGITDEPNNMYGKVMSIPDSLVASYFKFCTTLSDAAIKEILNPLVEGGFAGAQWKAAKQHLAFEIVKLYHDEKKAHAAQENFDNVFSKGESSSDTEVLKLKSGKIAALDLAVASGVLKSKSEARRLIEQGGFEAAGKVSKDPTETLTLKSGDIIRVGKKRFFKVKI